MWTLLHVTDLLLVVLYSRGDFVGYIDFLSKCSFIEGTKEFQWVCSFAKVALHLASLQLGGQGTCREPQILLPAISVGCVDL